MKKKPGGRLKPKTVGWIMVTFAVLCLAGLGFLWEKRQIHVLGREIKKLETDLDKLRRENEARRRTYASMCSPGELDARARKMNLGLSVPQPEQIVRMTEPVHGPAVPKVFAAGSPNETNN